MELTEADRELVEQVQRAREIVVAALDEPVAEVIAVIVHTLEERRALADGIAADQEAMRELRVELAWEAWAAAPVRSVALH